MMMKQKAIKIDYKHLGVAVTLLLLLGMLVMRSSSSSSSPTTFDDDISSISAVSGTQTTSTQHSNTVTKGTSSTSTHSSHSTAVARTPTQHYKDLYWWTSDDVPEGEFGGYVYPNHMYSQKLLDNMKSLCHNGASRTMGTPVFIYIHIYKTGGANFDSWLDLFGEFCQVNLVNYHSITNLGGYHNWFEPLRPEHFDMVAQADMLSGHQPYGLHALFPLTGAVYTTTLRRPENAFVSSIFYKEQKNGNAAKYKTMADGIAAVRRALNEHTSGRVLPYRQDFMARLTGKSVPSLEHMDAWTEMAIANLEKFAIVGLTEQWELMVDLFQHYLDPEKTWHNWDSVKVVDFNANGIFSTSAVVAALDDQLRQDLGEFVRYERRVYDAGVRMLYRQCLQVFDLTRCTPVLKLIDTRLPTHSG